MHFPKMTANVKNGQLNIDCTLLGHCYGVMNAEKASNGDPIHAERCSDIYYLIFVDGSLVSSLTVIFSDMQHDCITRFKYKPSVGLEKWINCCPAMQIGCFETCLL